MADNGHFRQLVESGVAVALRPERRNRREHHQDERIYCGPMAIPERIAGIIAEHPGIKRTTDRHLVSRYAEGEWTWVFRAPIPEHRLMVGEIVRTWCGHIRIHCWSTADPERYTRGDEPAAIVANKQPSSPARPVVAILPPLLTYTPEWKADAAEAPHA
jgi:hypothetical protein